MARLLFVFGTRPEFIKIYPVIDEARSRGHDVVIANTGQHKEMVNHLLEHFGVKVDHDLKIMDSCNGLADILAYAVRGLDAIVADTAPDLVLVHGDTSTTLAGSLAAYYRQVPLAHIEAGLRTYNKYSPYPEEINRQVTGVVADHHFAPTDVARRHLLQEHRPPESVYVVGNSAIDMLRYTLQEGYTHPVLDGLDGRRLVLVTVHRRENLDDLAEVFDALNEIASRYRDTHKLVYPVHLNPVIRRAVAEHIHADNIELIEPLETIAFHNVMNASHLVLTDSGGIQEEAPSMGKPVLVLRDTTERPEGVAAGTLKLVGTSKDDIVRETCLLLDDEDKYQRMATVANPYGDGWASRRMVNVVERIFEGRAASPEDSWSSERQAPAVAAAGRAITLPG